MGAMSINLDDDYIATLIEHVELLVAKAKGFVCEMLTSSHGTTTYCAWKTSVMMENFEKIRYFTSTNAMKKGINEWPWPCLSITLYNELRMVRVGHDAII